MTITGAVKFFGINIINEDCSFSFSSANTSLSSYLYDRNRASKLTSFGSTDATLEYYEINFPSSRTFNRIWIDNHNIKIGSIKYWDGTAYTDFSNPIVWYGNASTTNYYEFNPVSSTKIRVEALTTIIPNDQKYIGELRVFIEIGTVGVNASSVDSKFVSKQTLNETATGGIKRVVFGRKYRARWTFNNADASDIELFDTLDTIGTPFHIFPCGGNGQSEYGFRLRDLYLVNLVDSFSPTLKSNLFGVGMTANLEVAEV